MRQVFEFIKYKTTCLNHLLEMTNIPLFFVLRNLQAKFHE